MMATGKRPWPDWAANGYYRLRRLAKLVVSLGNKADEIQYRNVYLLAKLLTAIAVEGREIRKICRSLELEKAGWQPRWFIEAIANIKKYGAQIDAGAKHALDGLEKDNWKMVVKGINHCLDYGDRIQMALLNGPQPAATGLNELIQVLEKEFTKDDGHKDD